jgi:hypothetical protein
MASIYRQKVDGRLPWHSVGQVDRQLISQDFTRFARPFNGNLALSMNRRNRLSDFASVV